MTGSRFRLRLLRKAREESAADKLDLRQGRESNGPAKWRGQQVAEIIKNADYDGDCQDRLGAGDEEVDVHLAND